MAGLQKGMNIFHNSAYNWVPVISALFLIFLISLLSHPGKATGVNVVNVNARIKPVQIIRTKRDDSDPARNSLVTSLELDSAQHDKKEAVTLVDEISFEIGSNKRWSLLVKGEEISMLEDELKGRGWELEDAFLSTEGERHELGDDFTEIDSGKNGSFKITLTCTLILEPTGDQYTPSPSLDGLDSKIAFQVK